MAGHKHAQAMHQYAIDALTHTEPWQLWEVLPPSGHEWQPLVTHPGWYDYSKYRRKSETTVVNGVEVCKGISEPPAQGTTYYYVDTASNTGVSPKKWCDDRLDQHMLQHGLAHTSWEAARHHWKALVAPTERK